MKGKGVDNLMTALVIVVVMVLTGLAVKWQWWNFVIPVFMIGIIINFLKWNVSTFSIGFLSGFIVWVGGNLYFSSISEGIVFNRITQLLAVNKIIVLSISGVIGGLVTGLSLYTGKKIITFAK